MFASLMAGITITLILFFGFVFWPVDKSTSQAHVHPPGHFQLVTYSTTSKAKTPLEYAQTLNHGDEFDWISPRIWVAKPGFAIYNGGIGVCSNLLSDSNSQPSAIGTLRTNLRQFAGRIPRSRNSKMTCGWSANFNACALDPHSTFEVANLPLDDYRMIPKWVTTYRVVNSERDPKSKQSRQINEKSIVLIGQRFAGDFFVRNPDSSLAPTAAGIK